MTPCKEVADLGKLIRRACRRGSRRGSRRGRSPPAPCAYRAHDAAAEVRGVLAHFPKPWRGLRGWCCGAPTAPPTA